MTAGDVSYQGCHGAKACFSDILSFLETNFVLNRVAEENDDIRFATCVWGHPGVGKTALVKEFRTRQVEWGKQKYDGYHVEDVPVAQFEEMGDLHGIPMDCVLMFLPGKKSADKAAEQWVPLKDETVRSYRENGWQIDTSVNPTMRYAPPAWVPQRAGPSILLLDDWNRASIRIVKGIMQLLQNYGMVSWSLPAGCNIVLTGNPDDQDYLVTTIDPAILTRIRHITLIEDMTEWAIWAERKGLDERGINYALTYPEMLIGPGRERTNPRTFADFCRYLTIVGDVSAAERDTHAELYRQAIARLDERTANSLFVFFKRELKMIVDPMKILEGDEGAFQYVENLMNPKKQEGGEARVDIVGVIGERLFARMMQSDIDPNNKDMRDNFQRFLTMDVLPQDVRHGICRRIAKQGDMRANKWLVGSAKLRDLVMQTLRTATPTLL